MCATEFVYLYKSTKKPTFLEEDERIIDLKKMWQGTQVKQYIKNTPFKHRDTKEKHKKQGLYTA